MNQPRPAPAVCMANRGRVEPGATVLIRGQDREQHGEPIVATETFWPASDTEDEDAGELNGYSTGAIGAPLKRKVTAGTKSRYPSGFKAAFRKLARSFNKGMGCTTNQRQIPVADRHGHAQITNCFQTTR